MLYEICAILAVVIFGILTIFLIRTLMAARKTLSQHTLLAMHLDEKLKKMSSTFQAISNLGDISESKTTRLRENMLHPKREEHPKLAEGDYADDLVTLLLTALKLGSKYLKGK